MITEQTTIDEAEKALANFLLDIECLRPLAKYTSGVNVFDVLRITKTEIRHSNMLAWLLNSNENHGLGDQFIRGIFQCLVEGSEKLHKDIFRVLMADFRKFTIRREYNNIDLLLTSVTDKIVLCIENKIDSEEHDNQLHKYYSDITQEYSSEEWLRLFVFLSPDGREASDSDNWLVLSYSQVAEVLQHCMRENEINDDSRMILEHYLKIIRRDIVTDKELIEICNNIYTKHQKALDLIFDNKQDVSSVIYSIIVEWCKNKAASNEIIFDENDSNKSYIRFTTANLNTLYPLYNLPLSGWKNNHPAFYEFNNNNGKIRAICSVSAKNLPQSLIERTKLILKDKCLRDDWTWKTILSFKSCKSVEDGHIIEKERIHKFLDTVLSQIKDFEIEKMSELGLINPIQSDKHN